MAIIPIIIEQHAEEAAFLWLLRDSAINDPHYSLKDLAHLDDRVEANIDGLCIAGDDGWEICKEALDWEESGEIFQQLSWPLKVVKRIESSLLLRQERKVQKGSGLNI